MSWCVTALDPGDLQFDYKIQLNVDMNVASGWVSYTFGERRVPSENTIIYLL